MDTVSPPSTPPGQPGGDEPPGSAERPPGPRAFNVPPVTLAASIVLIAVFGVLTLAPVSWTTQIVGMFSVRPLFIALAVHDPTSGFAALSAATLVTHALIHIDGAHILLNVGFLLAFGSMCERALGPRRFFALLILTAISGALAKLALDWNEPVIMFGASGAVFGCMGAFIRLLIGGPAHIRRRGLTLMLALVAANLIFTFIGPAVLGLDGRIAWDAHLGGFVAGFVLGWPPRRPAVGPEQSSR